MWDWGRGEGGLPGPVGGGGGGGPVGGAVEPPESSETGPPVPPGVPPRGPEGGSIGRTSQISGSWGRARDALSRREVRITGVLSMGREGESTGL